LQASAPLRGPLRFGVFELDVHSGELRKHGVKIKLQDQPFQILLILLEQAPELVTREELQKRVWPADTFVDFDKGLYNAIKKLREALGDEAGTPRYVETVPKRGYRFIAPVEGSGRENTAATPGPIPVPAAERGQAVTAPRSRSFFRMILSSVAILLVAAGIWYGRVRGARRLTDKDTIVLASFANSTNDAVFDETLKTALSISLRQSPFLNVLSDESVAKTLQQMTLPVDTKVTPEVARELCERVGGKAYLAGAIGILGSEYVVGLKAANCQSGDILAEEQITAGTKEKVLDALGTSASKLRGELGESLATVKRFDIPLEQATTSSLEALKAYSLGVKAWGDKGPAAALPYHQRAIELDPNFALGYWAVGDDYGSMSEPARAREYFRKAFELREHTSERERLTITGIYYLMVTGELDKAAQTYQEEIESYPRDTVARGHLGVVFSEQGRYEKSSEITRQALRLAPDDVGWYQNLSNNALELQRFDEVRQIAREAESRKLDSVGLHMTLYAVAFLSGDEAQMAKQQQWFASQPDSDNYGLSLAADTEAYRGRLGKALELSKQAVNSAIRADDREGGATWQADAALQQAAFGNKTASRKTAAEALRLAPTSRTVESEAALAFAMAGDTARAESIVADLGKRFPLDTEMQLLWLPTIQAQLELNARNPAAGANLLQAASAIELSDNDDCLYHVYVRAEAYLAGERNTAAAEFQKILDHPGLVVNCWTGALARLGVARSNALQAKKSQRLAQGADADAARVRALAAYKDFLTLWKDADPDIPVLKQAKAEYAKLQ
jgi:eukaryotic-like serine/threonine-protein kinase